MAGGLRPPVLPEDGDMLPAAAVVVEEVERDADADGLGMADEQLLGLRVPVSVPVPGSW